MKAAFEQIAKDAEKKGWQIRRFPCHTAITRGKSARSIGVVLWEDGTAHRSDVPLDAAKNLRSIKAIREILDL
jgi:hypothetical protein